MASSSIFTSFKQSWPSSRFSFRINSSNFSISGNCNPLLGHLESKLADQLELLKLQQQQQQETAVIEDNTNLNNSDELNKNPSINGHSHSYFSAKWLSRAMAVVLSTNSSVKAFVPDLQHAFPDSASLSKWLDDCLDDNIRLLDACLTLQNTVSSISAHHSFAKLVLELMIDSPCCNEATLRRAQHALSKWGNLFQTIDNKRSKLESCGLMLRRMGDRLQSSTDIDSSKGNALGVMFAAQITTILICCVLVAALSIPQSNRRSSFSTISISTQSSWSLALSSLQSRVKEQVDRKKAQNQRMPYLEELENVDSLLDSLEEFINHALEAHQFPMDLQVQESMKQTVLDLNKLSDELGHGLSLIEQHISELYQVLITSRMMLLDIYPKSSAISNRVLALDSNVYSPRSS